MDLRSDQPFWPLKNGLLSVYPELVGQHQCDIAIVGAGITGALIGHRLTQAGYSVVLVDQREVAHGSTSASTALLQYEIDTPLTQLQEWYGPTGEALYRAGVDAITSLQQLTGDLEEDVCFRRRPSLYFASGEADLPELCREYEARRAIGLPVEYWSADDIASHYDFRRAGGILSKVAAEVDPFSLTHALLRRIRSRGGQVFDRSPVQHYEAHQDGCLLRTHHGSVQAQRIVIAAGFESQKFLPANVASLHSTFAFVSAPVGELAGWHEQSLLWETSRPYLYLRTTADGRILAGGEDIVFKNAAVRDSLLPAKVEKIAARVREMFPRIPLSIDYSWAGTFAETRDGLPFIGEHPECPGLLFAMCYGGNGITYSVWAAEILLGILQQSPHPLQDAVSFQRKIPV